MTKQEVLQKIMEAAIQALSNSQEFSAACEHMDEVELHGGVLINMRVSTHAAAPADPRAASDADFLRSLRIQPDLEAQ
jgi:hypothetical protein